MSRSPITWLIDLDNTLHNASHAIFPVMHQKMNAYMAEVLGDGDGPADEALVDATRRLYWKKYGATLLGLIEHHGVSAAEFLRFTHDFDQLPDMLRFESGLAKLFRRLPGQKILFTNAPREYAGRVVRQIGLNGHFDHHVSIEAMHVHRRLRPKPSRLLLRKILAKRRLSARHCVLVEDSRDNLRSAKQMGLKTVWITQYHPAGTQYAQRFARARFIDIKIKSIKQLPTQISKLSSLSSNKTQRDHGNHGY